ncbi:MAG: TerC family protein [Alphaproteobacteria bacterium]|nr:TerC family protein [Alphaproteobacteria bacterium]
MEPTSLWLWLGFNLFVVLLLAFDLGVLHRKQREIRVAEALWLSFGYFVLAGLFNAGVFYWRGSEAGFAFMTGYLIEKSLSLDNIFVFVLVFTHFAVPPQYQHRVLFWGVLGALAMRAALIAVGASLIETFHWIVFVFGAFLIVTGIKMLLTINAKPDLGNNAVIALLRRWFRVTPDYHGERFFVRRDGVLWMTPLFLVLALVEISDLVFAIDSIPAIFAITSDPFIVYTANVFAILGLRALYFALAGIIHRFHYLKYGLSLTLLVVGMKMILNGVFGEKVVPTEVALLITAVLIFGSMALSLLRTRGVAAAPAERYALGWVPGSRPAADVSQSR